jgi:hypothetical protein
VDLNLPGVGLGPASPQLPPPPAGLRGRVEQQVDALTGSAGKVLSGVAGVADASFGVLRAFLPGGPEAVATPAASAEQGAAPWNAMRPAFGLLRRESGFSIASLAASLPGRERARSALAEEAGRQMTEVNSRPGSRASLYAPPEESEDEEGDDDDDEGESGDDDVHDTRSIRSFGSMMSDRRNAVSRKSLADRLASVSGVRLGQDSPKVRLACFLGAQR